MMPVSSTIIITTDVRRKARHTGRPVSLNRAPPASLPPSADGLGSPTSRDLTDASDLRVQRR